MPLAAAPLSPTTPRAAWIIAALSACLIGWVSIAAIVTVLSSYPLDRPWPFGLGAVVAALLISAGAFVIGRALPTPLWLGLGISGTVLALGSAVHCLSLMTGEAGSPPHRAVMVTLQAMPAIGALLWAPALSCAAIAVLARRRAAPRADGRWAAWTSGAALLGSVVVCVYLTQFARVEEMSWDVTSPWVAAAAMIGVLAAVVLLWSTLGELRTAVAPWSLGAVVLIVVVVGYGLACLSAVQAIYGDALGIGGILLWLLLSRLHPLVAAALLIGVAVLRAASRRVR